LGKGIRKLCLNVLASLNLKILFLPVLLMSTFLFGQDEETESGAVIILQAKGNFQVLDSEDNLLAQSLEIGSVLREGLKLVTKESGEISVLFSNGTISTIQPNSSLNITSFKQEPFEAENSTVGELTSEPSESSLELELDFGTLIVKTKKLDRKSDFQINTPSGSAGIRGTEFQLSQIQSGQCSLDVADSVVSFTTPDGTTTLTSTGKGLDISVNGTTTERNIDVRAKINILTKNSIAEKISAQIPLAIVNQAIAKAAKLLARIEKSKDSEEEDGETTLEGSNQQSTANRDWRSNTLRKLSNNQRSIPGTEASNLTEVFNSRSQAVTVSYEYDPVSNEIIIRFFDKGGTLIQSTRIPILNDDHQVLVDALRPWVTNYDKTIDAVALQVFMDQLKLGYSYDEGINDAMQSAIGFARVFLTSVNLSNSLPAANTWNAADLVQEFSNNPYAYEFGLLLTKYGALGEKNQPADNKSISSIGNRLIEVIGGRNNLKDKSYLQKILNKAIQPGEIINGYTIDGSLLGTRSIGQNDATKNLSLEVDRVVALVGSDVTVEANSKLDPSTLDTNGKNQVFSIAAAKDLIIKGDLEFENSLDSKQAISIGAADDVHFRSKSISDYFDGDFVEQYLNDPQDPVFLSDQQITPQSSPSKITVKNHGKDLGIGSFDKLELIDLDLSTQGHLAVGTLNELKILSTRFDESIEFSDQNIETVLNLNKFSAGSSQKKGEVFLYANDRIAINGLGFGSDVREIYMDAITLDLKNVKFPNSSEVMLKSKLGYPTFGHQDRKVGHVNFIKNVYHGRDHVDSSFFSADPSLRVSNKKVGTAPAIKIGSHSK
jgi:hypothetical protein